jgi:hypothetical protein
MNARPNPLSSLPMSEQQAGLRHLLASTFHIPQDDATAWVKSVDRAFPTGHVDRPALWQALIERNVSPNAMVDVELPSGTEAFNGIRQPVFFYAQTQAELDVFKRAGADPELRDNSHRRFDEVILNDTLGTYSVDLRANLESWMPSPPAHSRRRRSP